MQRPADSREKREKTSFATGVRPLGKSEFAARFDGDPKRMLDGELIAVGYYEFYVSIINTFANYIVYF